ncbi:FAD-dependent oxidoreductase [Nocardioides sp. LHD-245]|uniref:FAD-dependent oxidoreductase n=1 Tax=Nocardioides sp. LHD-245 TaxID=3051387 RepID=UPI0027E0ABB7|nr:FAD-dependent oxidoreductase [Nocardioides sp. LHD-245]
MRTVVVGGGVVGVTTAYYLARDGHEVTVVDKAGELGTDATGGNAGLIAPSHSFAWASPQAPKMLVRSLMGEATAIRVKLSLDPRFLWWGMQFMRECTTKRARANTVVKLGLAQYSQAEMYRLEEAEGLLYDVVKKGAVYLYRDEHELEVGLDKMALVAEHGQPVKRLTPDDLVALDPAFKNAAEVVKGAIHGVSDGSGNSEKFTTELARVCREKLGVRFLLGVSALRFVEQGGKVTTLVTDQGELAADQFVLAAGIQSPIISRTIGQDIPVFPAKGFSITAQVLDDSATPTVGGVDEKTLVAWSRLGDTLRISSTAQFDGYNRSHVPSDFDNIFKTARELFPGAADWDGAQVRSCMRPMTPDGPPIIGRGTKHSNLYYNTGHGHMGWTMACGSSLLLADAIAGRRPALDMDPFVVRTRRKGR